MDDKDNNEEKYFDASSGLSKNGKPLPKNFHMLKPFKPGQSGNPSGRPKRLASRYQEFGYKKAEVDETISVMLGLTMDDLKKIHDDKHSTILEKIIARALSQAMSKGSLYNLEVLLSRRFGSPKIDDEVKTPPVQNIQINIMNGNGGAPPLASSEEEIQDD